MRHPFTYFLFLIFTLTACSQNNKQIPHALRINICDEPQTLDPRKVRDLKSVTITQLLFDGLTRVNQEEKTELSLAKSVEISEDLKTYTFHLKDTLWSNGDALTAYDFVYAWKKVLSSHFPSDMAFQLYVIKNSKAAKEGKISIDEIGVHAPDPKTLIVELENPTPYFLELVAFPAFFPVNSILDQKNPAWAQNAATFVGNGPFRIAEWKHQDRLTVKKNENYWDAPTVKLETIVLNMVNEETELKMFEHNELDWAGSPLSTLPIDSLSSLKRSDALKTKELLGTYFIRTNTNRTPFNHPAIRRAFALAIDRQAIVEHVTQGNQFPATGLVPISFGLQSAPYFKDGDLIEAKRLFEEGLTALGLKKEAIPLISLIYRAGDRSHAIAQAVQQQWFSTFGIHVKLEPMEGKVYMDRISKKDYDLVSSAWIADFQDPINFLDVFKYKEGGSNNTFWENPRFAELLNRSLQVIDPNERRELLAQSEQILIDEMPVLPIFYFTMLYLNQPYVKNVVLTSMGRIDFKWASIENNDQKVIAQGDK